MTIAQEHIEIAEAAQHEAAQDVAPQIRLVAGPGTGKSFAIQERIRWLLEQGIAPSTIFVVSFTRASARDLRTRIHEYCLAHDSPSGCRVSVTTLHSLALRILRAAGLLTPYPADPMVMDKWELENIFDAEFSRVSGINPSRCADIRRDHEAFWSTGEWGPPNYLPPEPPVARDERSRFDQFHGPRTQTYSCVLPGEIVRNCVQSIAAGTLDPTRLLRIFHLIADEFQDLNPADLAFVHHLIASGVITFVAGDDDQSIYAFRFASPQGIQTYVQTYPGAGDYRLTHCFRCTPSVLRAATSVITQNPLPNRIPKAVQSLYEHADPPLAGNVILWQFASGVAEARAIAVSCRDLIQAGVPPRGILILISNRPALEGPLLSAFDAVGVPYERPRSDGYVDSEEGRLALAFLRLTCNEDDYVAYRTILGLRPGVGIATCNNVARAVVHNNLNFRQLFDRPLPSGVFQGRELRALNSARQLVGALSDWERTDMLEQRDGHMQRLLEDFLGTVASQAWIQKTSHLPRLITLEEVRDYLWADTDQQQEQILNAVYERLTEPLPPDGVLPGRVAMMTMHGAKGLSGNVVFVPGLEEEILPGQWRRPYPGLVLEAARLLYVSVARARAACIVSYASTRVIHGQFRRHTPSRFTNHLGDTFTYRQAGGLSQPEVQTIARECRLL